VIHSLKCKHFFKVFLIIGSFFLTNLNAAELQATKSLPKKISELQPTQIPETKAAPEKKAFASQKKTWNFMVYVAANNDLYRFAEKNILQMLKVGSNKDINILVQLDIFGEPEVTRFYIEKNNAVAIEHSIPGISGTPENLFDFARWGIENYPAEHQALILWNHGSGIEDPHIWGKIYTHKPNGVYSLNQKTGRLELNKEVLQKEAPKEEERGICFNENFETYLTNQELKATLDKISKELLNKKKIDIIGMDACNMGMIEVATQLKDCANFLVASEEVEPGTGWNYQKVLTPFKNFSQKWNPSDWSHNELTPEQFAKQMVKAYRQEYDSILAEYTQSAINLSELKILEKNVNNIALILLEMLKENPGTLNTLKKIRRNPSQTTTFGTTNYVDLLHFYKSLKSKLNKLENNTENFKQLKILLERELDAGLLVSKDVIIENVAGYNYSEANGLSIYFPRRKIHDSYFKTIFATEIAWVDLLKKLTSSK